MHVLYNLFGLNQAIFFAVNGIRGAVVDRIMLLGSQLGDFWNLPWIMVAAAVMFIIQTLPNMPTLKGYLPEKTTISRFILVLLTGYAIAAISVALLKVGLQMPRPSLAMPSDTVFVLGEPEDGYSFPSGHSAFAMLLVVSLWSYCSAWLRTLLVFFSFWVGISRVNIGAHFPVDIIVGYICGGLGAWIAIGALTIISRTTRSKQRSLET